MDHSVWITVLGICGVLTLAVMVLPLANRLNFPFTVMLAAVGVGIGLVARLIPEGANLGVITDLFEALHRIEITSEAVFFVFLPALVFESALAIDVRRLLEDIAPILLLAVVGLLISTVVVGLTLQWVSGYTLLACLLLGAIVSATDPVAVVAIFKDLGAPKRLAILVEGESLFNDATAIVVFTILSSMLLGTADPSLLGGIGSFLKVFLGGVAVGYVLARIACFLMGFLGDAGLPKIALSVALAYISFIAAEHYLHMSGVMAVVTASLVLGSRGRSVISISAWHGLEEVWETIGFLANSVIFVLVGVAVPSIMAGFGGEQFTWLVVLLVAAFVARFFIIFFIAPVMSKLGWAAHVERGYQAVMFWGGLRGAVSLALALAVMENTAFSQDIRDFIGVLVTGFVLFTLAINATTVQLVMRAFGLDKLSPVDMAIRSRALSTGLSGIGESVRKAAETARLEPALADEVAQPVEERAAVSPPDASNISHEDWLRIGLRIAAQNENKIYHSYFDQGLVSPETARLLFSHAADIRDGIKTGGIEGYKAAYRRHLAFRWQTRVAGEVQRRLGISGPLARRLASRFAVLEAACMGMRQLLKQGSPLGRDLVGGEVADEVRSLAQERLSATEQALDSLRAAYPEYANALEKRMLQQIAVRLEQNQYKSMLSGAIIGKEVYSDLMRELGERAAPFRAEPALDLGLDAEKLVGKVPFFAELAYERKQEIARMLKPRLALPGEEIVHEGDKGDAMYFVSSGAVRVDVEPKPVILGSGDFFGELALLSDKPRKVSVHAEGFCDLLTLYTKDFRALLDAQPDLKATIEKVAAERA